MAQLKLFGEEIKAIVKPAKTTRTRTPRTKEPTIDSLKWEIESSYARLKELEAQDETGWNQFDKDIKGKEVNMKLVRNHISYYRGQMLPLRKPLDDLLKPWKEFLVNLCKERGHEIDVVWLDTSAPYDCAINIRLKNHRCWSSCVTFRFNKDGRLQAYDSHFGGGTTFVNAFGGTTDVEKTIREVMEKVFNSECSNSSWENRGDRTGDEHRIIKLDEEGWII